MTKLQDSAIKRLIKTNNILAVIFLVQTMIFIGGLLAGALYWVNALIVAVLLLSSWACWWFMQFKAKFTLEQIGVENVQLVGAQMGEDWRDRVWSDGFITIKEWTKSCKQAGIEF